MKSNLMREDFIEKKISLNTIDSYIFGLLVTDGHMHFNTRNRGNVSLEISKKDEDICHKLVEYISNSKIRYRTRTTNFAKNYKSCKWVNYSWQLRKNLVYCGFPTENKTLTCSIPKVKYSEIDFWRGVIDGDGSVGFRKTGKPFIGFGTKSKILKNEFLKFLDCNYNIHKNANRNKRDNFYNITITNGDAQILANSLYRNAELYIDRKYKKAKFIFSQQQLPKNKTPNYWDAREDNFILSHSVEESISKLNRSKSSVKTRLWRLRNRKIKKYNNF